MRNKKGQFIKGHVMSLEVRKKLSDIHKKLNSGFRLPHLKGKKHHFFGKKRSKAFRKKISDRQKLRIGAKNSHWKGGIHKRKDGYMLVRLVDPKVLKMKYKLQHRVIVEKFIGRKLLEKEIIHHKNGDNSDNRIENLQIMTQSEHAKLHRSKIGKKFCKISDLT